MSGEVILYNTEDGHTQLRLEVVDGTVWLSQAEMAGLFQTTPQNITQHIRTLYGDGELERDATCKDFLQVQTEGERQVQRRVSVYRLEMILAVGYRVRSPRGTQFRRWATTILQDYLIKGFALDDRRLKEPAGGGDYFDDLLERVREIRASEKRFYQKVRDLFATAKNYLMDAEVTELNLLVSAFLDLATDRAVLTHAGSVSHDHMLKLIDQRYASFDVTRRQAERQAAEIEHDHDIDAQLRQIEASAKGRKKTGDKP
jgi:hypothetical protein